MDLNTAEIQDLITKRNELREELRMIDHELASAVLTFKGSIEDALKAGIVRLNFTAPSGFYEHIRKGLKKI